MWRIRSLILLPLCGYWVGVTANSIVYVTDLTIFTSLAPCAGSAVSSEIQYQTYNNCPSGVTALQSCVCSQDNNLVSISKAIVSGVSERCSGTASQDQTSAATVLSAYCNQASAYSFPTPSPAVTKYITDIAELDYLAPCAYSALTSAVMYMTYYDCPPDAEDLATCACQKNQNSLAISATINSGVKERCSTHTDDISSAQAMFAAYCGLNNGTSSFPTPAPPPGSMTYYITALPDYSSLAPCAADAVSWAVASQTWELCPNGPEALASCVCLKPSMSASLTNSITSAVKESCASTASAQISSAINVFAEYCSAANAQITVGGIVDTAIQSTPTARAGSGATSGGAASTGTGSSSSGGSSGGSNGGSGSGTSSSSSSGSSSKIPVIIGVVVGIGAVLGIAAFAVYFIMKNNRRKAAMAAMPPIQGGPGPAYPAAEAGGKPELAGTPISTPQPPLPPASPALSTLKPGTSPSSTRLDSVSPVSAHGAPYPPPPLPPPPPGYPPHGAELHAYQAYQPPHGGSTELHGQTMEIGRPVEMPAQGMPYPPPPNRPELVGNQYPGPWNAGAGYGAPQGRMQGQPLRPEAHGQPVYEAQSHQRPAELSGMGYHSGPVPTYELDGNNARGGPGGFGQAR